MHKLTKPKRNPWAVPMWLVEHPFVLAQIVLAGASVVLVMLTPLWGLFFAGAFLCWCLMFVIFVGMIFVFFDDGGYDDIERWVRNKYRNYGQVED